MSARQLAMTSASGESSLLLEEVQVRGTIDATLARIVMRQEYRNDTDRNVEAIYTFPLSPSAVLLRTTVQLGGATYQGCVMAKSAAEQAYEDAVAEGDTAIMVERPEPGIYTMNLGNLMADESATIEIEFAQLLDWNHDRLRLALPMTIAPRFGEGRSALAPHARPNIDMLVERPFDLELRINVDGIVSSPSHSIASSRSKDALIVSLRRSSAWMDRDFVLVVQAAHKPEPFAAIVRDGDEQVGYVSFQVPEAREAREGRDVRLVIDCSGSMAGASIAMARQGAINLINRLRLEDRFAVVAFGSSTKAYRNSLAHAGQEQVEKAISWLQVLEADMGGTELAQALDAAMSLRGARSAADIFLITDGQVGESAQTVARAQNFGHRVFVVGIGVSPSRGLLEEIADSTGGAIDYVTSGEDAAEAVGRQFARITQTPVSDISVESDVDAPSQWRTGLETTIFSGSTVHAFCRVKADEVLRSARVSYRIGATAPCSFEVPYMFVDAETSAALLRVAANERIRRGLLVGTMDLESAEGLAVTYQLVTAATNYVLAIHRADAKASNMPVTMPVKTMLAAGWGGTGHVGIQDRLSSNFMVLDQDIAYSRSERRSIDMAAIALESSDPFVQQTNDRFGSLLGRALPLSLPAILGMNLPRDIAKLLRQLIDEGHSEDAVMRAFWAAFGLFLTPATTRRGLARRLRAISASADQQLTERILAELHNLETA